MIEVSENNKNNRKLKDQGQKTVQFEKIVYSNTWWIQLWMASRTVFWMNYIKYNVLMQTLQNPCL